MNILNEILGSIKPSVEIITKLENQEVDENEAVSMVCKASEEGYSATWYKDGEEIRDSEKYLIESESDTYTLTIPKSTVDDSGEFTIRIGDEESSANLVVNGENMLELKQCMVCSNSLTTVPTLKVDGLIRPLNCVECRGPIGVSGCCIGRWVPAKQGGM